MRNERGQAMRIGVVGTGYVFDHYMTTLGRHPELEIVGVADLNARRAADVGRYYGLKVHETNEALFADPAVECVANFTSIPSHHAVSRAALEAGRHVYSEKPLATTLEDARDLARLAEERGLRLSCAPSNALSSTVGTMWKAVADGLVGTPRLVYAEFDDNPVYLLSPETWASRSGASWPYLHEYEMGCTWEHAGYHLVWMCALFGPVRQVTSFSAVTLPDKTARHLEPADTPDFSVGVLHFESGVVGRLTCSIAAPTDHRMRIIGDRGEISADTYRHYECPVRFEPFTGFSLKARNARWVRRNSLLQWPFGVGGHRLPLVSPLAPHRREGILRRLKRDQFGQQDKCAGLAELAAAIAEGRPHFPPPDLTLHLTELTLAIQAGGGAHAMETTFSPLPLPDRLAAGPDYTRHARPGPVPRLMERLMGNVSRS
jgi:predicted dehydrogenase